MLSVVYRGKGDFALLEKPLPKLQDERDAIVRVTLSSICSSDLHIKHGNQAEELIRIYSCWDRTERYAVMQTWYSSGRKPL